MRSHVLAGIVVLLPSFVLGQSLGEAAKKEEARRKAAQSKTGGAKVVTDQDLAANKGRLANDPSDAPASEASPDRKPETGRVSADEAYRQTARGTESQWRAWANAARARIRAAEEAVAKAEEDAKPLEARATFRVPARDEERTAVLKARDAARARLAEAKRGLDALEENARRSGVPPGWLRD